MTQQKTLALAWVMQAHTEESGFPLGVLCDVAQELQQCMAPLLVHNSNKIVEASLLRPVEGECSPSPLPEEAALMGDIKADIMPDIMPPQVPA